MSRTAIIGSGFVGRAWAISFARAGHEVALWDRDPAAPPARGAGKLGQREQPGWIGPKPDSLSLRST